MLIVQQAKLKKILKDNKIERRIESKRGKLNNKALYKSGYNNKIFLQKNDTSLKDYHIELLIDGSGSMIDQSIYGKIVDAIYIAGKLVEILKGLAYINITVFNMATFKLSRDTIIHYAKVISDQKEFAAQHSIPRDEFDPYFKNKVGRKMLTIGKEYEAAYHTLEKLFNVGLLFKDGKIKKYNSLLHNYNHLLQSDFKGIRSTDGNAEGCNIIAAAKRLRNKTGNKFIFVILDGLPNPLFRQEELLDMYEIEGVKLSKGIDYKDSVTKIENSGIKVFGIGIKNYMLSGYGMSSLYNNYIIVNRIQDIYSWIINYFEKHVRKY